MKENQEASPIQKKSGDSETCPPSEACPQLKQLDSAEGQDGTKPPPPKSPPTPAANKIPDHKLAEINATKSKSIRAAKLKYEESLNKAEEANAKADRDFKAVESKITSERKVLNTRIVYAIQDAESVYCKCVSPSDVDIPDHEEAICAAQFNLERAKIFVEFQTKSGEYDSELAAAKEVENKGKKASEVAKCVAAAEKEQAIWSAETEWYKSVSKELKN